MKTKSNQIDWKKLSWIVATIIAIALFTLAFRMNEVKRLEVLTGKTCVVAGTSYICTDMTPQSDRR